MELPPEGDLKRVNVLDLKFSSSENNPYLVLNILYTSTVVLLLSRGHRGCGRFVVGFTITYAISA